MKRKRDFLNGERPEIEDVDGLSEGEVVDPKLTPKQKMETIKKKKGTKVCKKFRQGKCHRGDNCIYLHTKKSAKFNNAGESNGEGTLVVNEEKPKSLYLAVCRSHFMLIVVITKSNGTGKYNSIAGIVAFSRAWITET
jgi:hypothetical protein